MAKNEEITLKNTKAEILEALNDALEREKISIKLNQTQLRKKKRKKKKLQFKILKKTSRKISFLKN